MTELIEAHAWLAARYPAMLWRLRQPSQGQWALSSPYTPFCITGIGGEIMQWSVLEDSKTAACTLESIEAWIEHERQNCESRIEHYQELLGLLPPTGKSDGDLSSPLPVIGAGAVPVPDTPTGWDRAPDRYTASGRETVDRMRDLCRALVRETLDAAGLDSFDPGEMSGALGDAIFAVACDTHALKYKDRRGLKDDAEIDARKEAFWTGMAAHVWFGDVYPDPRHQREGFAPYEPRYIDPLR